MKGEGRGGEADLADLSPRCALTNAAASAASSADAKSQNLALCFFSARIVSNSMLHWRHRGPDALCRDAIAAVPASAPAGAGARPSPPLGTTRLPPSVGFVLLGHSMGIVVSTVFARKAGDSRGVQRRPAGSELEQALTRPGGASQRRVCPLHWRSTPCQPPPQFSTIFQLLTLTQMEVF